MPELAQQNQPGEKDSEISRRPEEEMRTAFEAFKKEALQRKRAVKEKTASPKEFTDWLYQQSNIIVELLNYCT